MDLRAEADRLVVRSAFYPTSLLTMLTGLGVVALVARSELPVGLVILGGALFSLVAYATQWRAAKRGLDDAIAELEARLPAVERVRVVALQVEETDESRRDPSSLTGRTIP